ncbi:oxygenase MpaB family protein, partial [Kitasatospora sp. NPDC059571]|uniref:oxygenase MpaB family protein n=1 Tax=Kitasatospora sp. NPDC059571 TaxID=3346871 RepID=UPI003692FCE9
MREYRDPYARLVLAAMPEEARVGLTLGFVRTFAVPEIAAVLHGTGRMTGRAGDRAKATGAAMFTLIGAGPDSAAGRQVVEELCRVHDRPGITPELMHYVLACFTVCPLRHVDAYGRRPAAGPEREAAYAFHRELAAALLLPEPPGGDLAGTEAWMRDFERRRFARTAEGAALWAATRGLLTARLPRALAPLGGVFAGALLDGPLRAALGVRRAPAPPPPPRRVGGSRSASAVHGRWRGGGGAAAPPPPP